MPACMSVLEAFPLLHLQIDNLNFTLLVISEDMVKDGFEDIMNIDISSVAIEMMKKKYESVPQLKCILTNCYYF